MNEGEGDNELITKDLKRNVTSTRTSLLERKKIVIAINVFASLQQCLNTSLFISTDEYDLRIRSISKRGKNLKTVGVTEADRLC